MNRREMKFMGPGLSAWGVVVAMGVAAVACQRLDSSLTGGRRLSVERGSGGMSGGGGDPGLGGAGVESDCPNLRMQAYAVLQTNCSICHEAPGTPSLYVGNFNFILELDRLTSSTSPQSSTT